MTEKRGGTADETLARITELAREALQAQRTLAKNTLDLGRTALRGDADRPAAARAYLDAMSRESSRYWTEVTTLGIDYAAEVIALGTQAASRVVSDATAAGTKPSKPTAARARARTGTRSRSTPTPK